MTREEFEGLVVEAIDALPEDFRRRLDNVEVVVQEWPDQYTMQLAGIQHPTQLLGFYHGVPQTSRSSHYGMVLPDKISIYRQPIVRRCRSEQQIRDLTEHVLQHEIAHHFGISDDHLRGIGAY